jgi:hypothetical protein
MGLVATFHMPLQWLGFGTRLQTFQWDDLTAWLYLFPLTMGNLLMLLSPFLAGRLSIGKSGIYLTLLLICTATV